MALQYSRSIALVVQLEDSVCWYYFVLEKAKTSFIENNAW
jgi:hypothetical protein